MTTLPPLPGETGALAVSAALTLTEAGSIPNVSAAMAANAVAVPVMSTAPVTIVRPPSRSNRQKAPAASCAQPDSEPDTNPLALRKVTSPAPEGMLPDGLEAVAEAVRGPVAPVHHRLAFGSEVPQPELDGIDL